MKRKQKQSTVRSRFICHGYLSLSNHGGMKIQLSDDGDAARVSYYDRVSHWQKVKYNTKGMPFVTYYGSIYYLTDFTRVRYAKQNLEQHLKVV